MEGKVNSKKEERKERKSTCPFVHVVERTNTRKPAVIHEAIDKFLYRRVA